MSKVLLSEALMDYERDTHVSREYRALAKSALQFVEPLRRAMKLHKPRIAFARIYDDAVALYINGTADFPVFVISADALRDFEEGAAASPDEMFDAMAVTLAHELCHAYLETLGLYTTDFEHDEEGIEELARDWYDGRLGSDHVVSALDADADAALEGED